MSSTIKILPDNLIDMIAAGEVVERPASIVKELVENSIDANSTKIDISIEGSGKKLIKVVDNGYGMDNNDAQLALKRHATSKIESSDDLLSIHSFGFRGEALPSIAAVSHFILTTKSKSCQLATQINVIGGTISKVSQIGFPIGTQIEIKDLFSTIPARAKFLKGDSTELSHIIQTVIRESIPRPDISFSLKHNGRMILDFPVTSRIIERLFQIHGEDTVNQLIPIDKQGKNVSITGYISSPLLSKSNSQGEYLYINKRYIRNLPIQKTIHRSYGNRLPQGKYPTFILFIDIKGQLIDFNVHPAKLEVRFSNTKEILEIVSDTIQEALNTSQPNTTLSHKVFQINKSFQEQKNESSKPYHRTYCKSSTLVKTPTFIHSPSPAAPSSIIQKDINDIFVVCSPFFHFNNTYIIYESKAGLTIIDQHAAHERINYERFETIFLTKKIARQNLITNPLINLSPDEEVLLDETLPVLKELGFALEIFGPCTLILRTVPLYFKADPAPLLTEVFNQIKEMSDGVNKRTLIKPLAAKMACHNSIKAGESIGTEEMSQLIKQLSQTKEPFSCPHGRPTILNMTILEIEKKFGRIL